MALSSRSFFCASEAFAMELSGWRPLAEGVGVESIRFLLYKARGGGGKRGKEEREDKKRRTLDQAIDSRQ
eukprot:748806-Hanusia_phi.AAC.1